MNRRNAILLFAMLLGAVLCLAAGCSRSTSVPADTATSLQVTSPQEAYASSAPEILEPPVSTASDDSAAAPASSSVPSSSAVSAPSKPVSSKSPSSKPVSSSAPASSTAPVISSAAPKPASSTPSFTKCTGYSAFQNAVVDLVNQERTSRGLTALSPNSVLMQTATVKSQDMADNDYFDHQSPTYGSPFDLMKSYGITYYYAGENIAAGQTTPQQVMNDWMNSPGHRENILFEKYNEIGVGVVRNSVGVFYWTQHFTGNNP